MNLNEIKNIIRHLIKESKCPKCKSQYKVGDINVLASTNMEALFELKCNKCESTGIANVILTPTSAKISEINRTHKSISKDDYLDVKNFLTNFDGNFKKIFKE